MMCPATAAMLAAGLAAAIRARLAGGVHVGALASRAGVSQPQLSNWLAGRRCLSLESLDCLRIACGLGWCELAGCSVCAHRAPLVAVAAPRRVVAVLPLPASRDWASGRRRA
jgi:hypothetical protein